MKLSKILIFTMIFTLIITNSAMIAYSKVTPQYKDIPVDYWAYESIVNMTKQGFMLGNVSNDFLPASYMDKFETARILADVSGYKMDNPDIIQKNYSDLAYNKNSKLLKSYADKYLSWNNTTDRSIAYLIEKEIYLPQDLDTFISVDEENNEGLTTITKGELAVYLVKVSNKTLDATSKNYDITFNDVEIVDQEILPFLQYMCEVGVMAIDEENNFNPNTPVTKALFAYFLDKTIQNLIPSLYIEETVTPMQFLQLKAATADEKTAFDKIETVTAIFDSLVNLGSGNSNAINVILSDGASRIYLCSDKISITIDDYLKNRTDLKKGMQMVLTINNDEIIEIIANSEIIVAQNEYLQQISGYITGLPDENTDNITVNYIATDLNNEFYLDTIRLNFDENSKFIKLDNDTTVSNLHIGELVVVDYYCENGVISKLTTKSFEVPVTGVVHQKLYNEENVVETFVVKTTDDDFIAVDYLDNTKFVRNTEDVQFNQILIGDHITLELDGKTIKTLTATSVSSTAKGVVQEVFASINAPSYIIIANKDKITKYYVIANNFDPMAFKVGSEVELSLESLEISSAIILNEENTVFKTGIITEIKDNSIVMQTNGTTAVETIEVVAENLHIYQNGKVLTTFDVLKTGMYVSVFNSDNATQVSILKK